MLIGKDITLREYIILNRMSIEDFARQIDFSRNHVSLIMLGRKPLTQKFARAVDRVTKGAVKLENIVEKKDCAQSL